MGLALVFLWDVPESRGQSSYLMSSLFTTTMTLTDNAFSVGGSTFVVAGGLVGIGTASPSGALQVAGLITADNANVAPVQSTQPGSRFAPGLATTWYYTGESLTLTVPAGPSRNYRLVMRQMASNGATAGEILFSLGTSNATQNSGVVFIPYLTLVASTWETVNAETTLTLAPGTYNYYVWVDFNMAISSPQLADASTDNRLYCNLFAYPL